MTKIIPLLLLKPWKSVRCNDEWGNFSEYTKNKMRENIIKTKTFDFALTIVKLYKVMREREEYVISNQLLRCATSVGANVEEADAGQSKRDFIAKMSISAKEAREARYWLRLLRESQIVQFDYAKPLSDVDEIIRIITSIILTAQKNLKDEKSK